MRERSTQQLAEVYRALLEAPDHPTAEQVYERVRRRVPRISVGTVYRNLEKLRKQGRVRVLRLHDTAARFDAVDEEHDHFVCENCGRVEDVKPVCPPDLWRDLEARGYVVARRSVVGYGLCPSCAAQR